jgi:hypothetical protein
MMMPGRSIAKESSRRARRQRSSLVKLKTYISRDPQCMIYIGAYMIDSMHAYIHTGDLDDHA